MSAWFPTPLSDILLDVKKTKIQQKSSREKIGTGTGTVSATDVVRMTLPPRGHVEVREKQNGSWAVSYPDPGWIPCPQNCQLGLHGVMRGHKHDFGPQPQVETHYQPTSFEDAMNWAESLAEGREIKIVPFVPLHERRKQKIEAELTASI